MYMNIHISLHLHVWHVHVHVAVGTGVWPAEADTDGTHQQCAGTHCQPQTALPLLCWGGQTSQMLGPGVQ